MDLRILEIASHTDNNKVLKNPTHQSKNKNPICGDEMEISLVVKNDTVIDMGYQCKSCVYCQASVSLLSQKIKNKNLQEIREFIASCENIFENTSLLNPFAHKQTQHPNHRRHQKEPTEYVPRPLHAFDSKYRFFATSVRS